MDLSPDFGIFRPRRPAAEPAGARGGIREPRQATFRGSRSLYYVDYTDTKGPDTGTTGTTGTGTGTGTAEWHVSVLYETHALGLARLALVMLDDRQAAEDVVHDAFLGLYRRWDSLTDASAAVGYLRASVLNGCRTAQRRRARSGVLAVARPLESAEAAVLLGEEHRSVLAAIGRLPARQREAVVLRYYLDMTEDQAAEAMGVARGTVKSATSRAIAALGRMLKEDSQ